MPSHGANLLLARRDCIVRDAVLTRLVKCNPSAASFADVCDMLAWGMAVQVVLCAGVPKLFKCW